MNARALSDLLVHSTARPLADGEADLLASAGLSLERRLAAARAVEEFETPIAVQAADAFCDARPQFQAPAGSPRREKGRRDGRLMLRYFATSIREGSFAPLRDKVLAWFVGHLDEEVVAGDDVGVFLRFIGQAAEAKLPTAVWPHFQELLEPAVALCRNAAASGLLRTRHRRIADSAVRRVLQITPDFAQRHGDAALSKGKRDMEIFVQDFAKLLHEPSLHEVHLKTTAWLLEKVVPFVEGSADTWQWMFASLREAVVDRCGPLAGRRAGMVLDRVADHAERLVNAAPTYRSAAAVGELGASIALRSASSPGFDVVQDLAPLLAQANRRLVCSLLALYASGGSEGFPERLLEVWSDEYQPQLPIRTPEMQVGALQGLLAAAQQKAPGLGAQILQAGLTSVADVAKRAAAAQRLGTVAADVVDQTLLWAGVELRAFSDAPPAVRREVGIDLRLTASRCLQSAAFGSGDGPALRLWALRFLAPAWGRWSWDGANELLQALSKYYSRAASPADFGLLQPRLDEVARQLAEARKVQGLGNDFAAAGQKASERVYQKFGDHATANPAGVASGARDGRFLLEQVKQTLALGPAAEPALHAWFQEELVGRSGLPGRMMVEFLEGLKGSVGDSPLAPLLAGLQARAGAYAAAWKIEKESGAIAKNATEKVLARLPDYAAAIGAAGKESAVRDNAVTLRRLALFLLKPNEAAGMEFQGWWQGSVGRYIARRPNDLFSVNLDEVKKALAEILDPTELPPSVAMLETAYQGLV